MKKGFTIVEIIISISIILLIGGIATFFTFKDTSVERVNMEILEAAKMFINTENDENGINYKNGILSGGKGVQFTLQNLIDKGYVKEENVRKLELDKDNSYILATVSASDESYCGDGNIEIRTSWTWNDSDEPIYLCEYNLSNTYNNSNDLLGFILSKYGGDNNIPIKNFLTSNGNAYITFPFNNENPDYTYSNPLSAGSGHGGSHYLLLSYDSNGLFKRNFLGRNDLYSYYFRGNIKDNYVKIVFNAYDGSKIKEFNGRILSFVNSNVENDSELRVVLTDDVAFPSDHIKYGIMEDWCGNSFVSDVEKCEEFKEQKSTIFKQFTVCNDHTIDKVVDSSFKGECNSPILTKSSLITEYEAIMAGIAPYYYSTEGGLSGTEIRYHHSISSAAFKNGKFDGSPDCRERILSFSWIGENNFYTLNDFAVFSDDSFNSDDCSGSGVFESAAGLEYSSRMYKINDSLTNDQKTIIKEYAGYFEVLALDPEMVTFTGNGTEHDPYVINVL